jgi:hypothetical protein
MFKRSDGLLVAEDEGRVIFAVPMGSAIAEYIVR